jgi:hypothetical protein
MAFGEFGPGVAYEHFKIRAAFVEKDYWVTFALKNVATLALSADVIFKGGTSLSKAYNCIERSRKTLIALSPEAFGMKYEKSSSKTYVEKLMSRHLYDLGAMIGTDVEAQALADHDLYNGLITHREPYQRLSWINYETLGRKTISFIPPDDVLKLYKSDYETMQAQMIYGKAISFDELMERLAELQGKFKADTDSDS